MSWIRTTFIRPAAVAALLMIVTLPAAPAQECGNWTVTRAQPFSDMEAVAWGNGRFAGVGVGTATSFDGFAWVVPPTSGMAAGWAVADYGDVAFAGGRFVAVGATAVSGAWTGDILWSDDGVNWQRAVIPAVDIVRTVAYGNARWIAAATGTILWSDDGATWQQAAVTGTIGGAGIEAVVWTGDHWLAVGSWQGNQWSATSDDGTAWRVDTTPAPSAAALAANGTTVIGVFGNVIHASSDGTSWTATSLDPHLSLTALIWTGERFVAAGAWVGEELRPIKPVVLTSPDGSAWTSRMDQNGPQDGAIRDLAWSGSTLIAIRDTVGPALVSPDGISWSVSGPDSGLTGYGRVHRLGGEVIALRVANQGPQLAPSLQTVERSSDGVRWTSSVLPEGSWKDVAWGGGRFVALGDGDRVVTRQGSASWLEGGTGVPAGSRPTTVAAGPFGFVAGGAAGALLYSTNGESWQAATVQGATFDRDVAVVDWTGNRFLASAGKLVASSTDGKTWTASAMPEAPLGLSSFAAGGGNTVGVGPDGLIMLDEGGGAWRRINPFVSGDFIQVVWQVDRFYALTSTGLLLTSPRGQSWSRQQVGAPVWPNGLGTVLGRPLVVGLFGTVVVGECPPRTLGERSGRAMTLPGAAHTGGANSTAWRSDVVLSSPGDEPVRVGLWLLEEGGGDGTAAPVSVVVEPGTTVPLHDVLSELFGRAPGAGAIVIDPDRDLDVTSRTFTLGSGGTFGQAVPAVTESSAVGAGERVVLVGLAEDAAFRSNLGLVNLSGEELTVAVELYDASGALLGSRQYVLPPYGWRQIDRVLRQVTSGQIELAYAVLTGSGDDVRFSAYASIIDNASGDPVMNLPARPASTPVTVPAAARTGGFGGVAWRSDIDVVNAGSSQAAFTLELLGRSGGTPQVSPTLTLAPGAAVRYQDVLHSVFGASGAGGIRVVPTAGDLVVGSRTFAQSPAGTYGQAVPAVLEATMQQPAGGARLVGLSGSPAETTGFRSNIGASNLGDSAVTVHIELFAGNGSSVGRLDLAVPAHGFAQLDRVYHDLVQTPIVDGYAKLTWDPAEAVVPYASVVDNATGDPVLLLGAE